MCVVAGCDVSKGWIDVHVLETEKQLRLANECRAIDRLARDLPSGSKIGMEATGTMHELLADRLSTAGHQVYVINPRWISHYRRGIGARGKTDRSDALVIARFVAAEAGKLHLYQVPSPDQRELRGLLHRRQQVVRLRTAVRQSLADEAAGMVLELERLLKDIERRIAKLMSADPEIQALSGRLKSIPGIGPLTAAHLVQVFTRYPFGSCDSFIAHTGLDPRPNDSGIKRGRRRLSHHGDAALRSTLFMAAMAACKLPRWRDVFEANMGKGLPSTAAYIVVARKLARIAYSLFKSGQLYDSARLGACTGS
jgi:transposase